MENYFKKVDCSEFYADLASDVLKDEIDLKDCVLLFNIKKDLEHNIVVLVAISFIVSHMKFSERAIETNSISTIQPYVDYLVALGNESKYRVYVSRALINFMNTLLPCEYLQWRPEYHSKWLECTPGMVQKTKRLVRDSNGKLYIEEKEHFLSFPFSLLQKEFKENVILLLSIYQNGRRKGNKTNLLSSIFNKGLMLKLISHLADKYRMEKIKISKEFYQEHSI